MEERFELPLAVIKETLEDTTPRFLVPGFIGFAGDYANMIRHYAVESIEGSAAHYQGLSHQPFNGLMFSSSSANHLCFDRDLQHDPRRHDHSLNLERMILERGILRDIPVLYTALDFGDTGMMADHAKKIESYFFDLFDHIYVLTSKAQVLPHKNPILSDTRIDTPQVFPDGENPVINWFEHMSRTKRIVLRYEY